MTVFVDFVNDNPVAYDDNGHGHARGGHHRRQRLRLGRCPRRHRPSAHIVSLKVLDKQGRARSATSIAVFDWAVANRVAQNIRVVNLSVGARITQLYETDPLTLAAKRAVDAGIVVVTAAGNLGKNAEGKPPRHHHRPRKRAVGADGRRLEHRGHADALRRRIAPYSSRGTHAIDRGQAGPRRAGHRDRLDHRPVERVRNKTKGVIAQGHKVDEL